MTPILQNFRCPECKGTHIKIEHTTTVDVWYRDGKFVGYSTGSAFDCLSQKPEDFAQCMNDDCGWEGNMDEFEVKE